MKSDASDLTEKIRQILLEKKGLNVLTLQVGHFSSVADYLIIAEGLVDRHVIAMANTVVKEIRENGGQRPHHVEGLQEGEWVLIDYSSVIVHLFKPGVREKYRLEDLWSQGKIVSSKESISS